MFLLASSNSYAATYYLDPINGSANGDGTKDAPFGSLESVVKAKLIQSQQWQKPYTKESQLTPKNPDAPIKAGDTLILLDGFHGNIKLWGYINSDYITIDGGTADNAKLGSISFRGSSKWRLQNLSLSPFHHPDYDPSISKKIKTIIDVNSRSAHGPSSDFEILNNEVFSLDNINDWSAEDWVNNASSGISIGAKNVRVSGNLVRNIRFGITAGGSHIRVQNNQIINFSGDAMRGLSDDSVFEYNIIANGFKVDNNHDDGFQSFTNTKGFEPISRVTIRNNQFFYDLNHPNKDLISNYQGIGCFDGFFNDWRVENNLLQINHWHGITFKGANNTKIINNTVVDANPNDERKPWIQITPQKKSQGGESGTDNIVRNNIAWVNNIGSGIITDHNIDPNQYQLKEFFISPDNHNFSLRNSPLLVNKGAKEQSPKMDIKGLKRGKNPDLGAFEFRKSN